jgi:hypothetical protein
MATFFRNKIINEIGTTPEIIVTTSDNARITVIGMSLANLTQNNILVSVEVEDGVSRGFYIKDTLIPANTTLKALNGGEKLILAPENTLYISSNLDDSVDVILSYVEII